MSTYYYSKEQAGRFWDTKGTFDTETDTEFCDAACNIISKKAFKELKGMDPDFKQSPLAAEYARKLNNGDFSGISGSKKYLPLALYKTKVFFSAWFARIA